MGLVVKNDSSVALEIEDNAGVYKAPVDGDSYIAVKDSNSPFVKARENIESTDLTNTVEATAPRTGKVSASGEIAMSLKAGENAGDLPPAHKLILASMGGHNQLSSSVTKAGNTATILQVEDADIGKYFAKMPILINEAGDHQIRTIKEVVTTAGAATIELDQPLNAAPADNVEIGASVVYHLDSKTAKTLSCEFNIGGKARQEVSGLRASSLNIGNWTTGQTPELSFALQGTDLDQKIGAPTHTGNYSKSEVPVILKALTWLSNESIHYNELTLGLENEIGEAPSAALESGVLATSIIKQMVSGKINPYMSDVNVNNFDKYNLNEDISIFSYTFNPVATAGEFKQGLAIHIPKAKITSLPAAEVNGNMVDDIEWKAARENGNDTMFLAFF